MSEREGYLIGSVEDLRDQVLDEGLIRWVIGDDISHDLLKHGEEDLDQVVEVHALLIYHIFISLYYLFQSDKPGNQDTLISK